MPITFSNDLETKVADLRADYFAAVQEGAEPEVVEAKNVEYMNAFYEMSKENILKQARDEARAGSDDVNIAIARGANVLTAKEKKFFNELVNPDTETYKEPKILPETTIERVFDDIKTERPLLNKIKFNLAGINTRLVLAETEGQAVWGEIFGKIQGQIDANFKVVNFSQNKLTAFAVVPKDLIKFGPAWVERFVREQLAEVIGVAIEAGIVNGGGAAVNQPIGMTKDYNLEEGTVTDKTPTGELTFASAEVTAYELATVLTHLSTKENGKLVNIDGKVTLVVSPADQFMVKAKHTMQNVQGAWITSMPYNVDVVASETVPQGTVIALVGDRYEAVHTGQVELKQYDQTLALEDMDVFISKHFVHGMPADNKASAVYTLNIPDPRTAAETVPEA